MDFQATRQKIKEAFSRLFQKNKYEKVLEDYLALGRERPDDMRVQLKIAETYFKIRDIPNATAIYRGVAETYVEQNFLLKAVAVYKTVLKLNPELVDVNLQLGELYLRLDMPSESANQYRIAMNYYGIRRDQNQLLEISQKLLKIDPSTGNRRKLAEILQSLGKIPQAVAQYEILAQAYRKEKKFDELLHIFELIIPHKTDNHAMIKDMSILYLRRQEPDHAIRLMERTKVDTLAEFVPLYDKAKLMKKALRAPASFNKAKTA